ncbi:hypothetical protein D3C81_1101180 [compost metagenome]
MHVLIEQRGGDEQDRCATAAQFTAEGMRIEQGLMVDDHHATAIEQRPPDVHGARIERRVRGEDHTILRIEIGVTVVEHQAADAPVRHHHSFRRAGGTGGVHDVRQRLGRLQQVRVVRRLAVEGQLVEVDTRRGVVDDFVAQGQQRHRAAILDHERLALARCIDVQRHISGRAFGNGQLRDQQLQRTRQQDRHVIARLHAVRDQVMGQAVGLRVEFKVAQRMRTMHGRHSFGMRGCLLLENPVYGQCLRVATRRGVEVVQQALALIICQQWHTFQHRLIIGNHRFEQTFEVADVPLDRQRIEQRRGVVQRAAKHSVDLAQCQRQVKLGDIAGPGNTLQRQLAQGQLRANAAVPA